MSNEKVWYLPTTEGVVGNDEILVKVHTNYLFPLVIPLIKNEMVSNVLNSKYLYDKAVGRGFLMLCKASGVSVSSKKQCVAELTDTQLSFAAEDLIYETIPSDGSELAAMARDVCITLKERFKK